MVLGLPFAVYGAFTRFAQDSVFTHGRWRRPVRSRQAAARTPRVSIHVPCYAEPPDIVISTLNALDALDYPNFEVLVCDNNTADPALWAPLRDHCDRLNARRGVARFRFFHVSPLAGAKAGALNFGLARTDPAAELVAVADADYVARPDFLSGLVAFFVFCRVRRWATRLSRAFSMVRTSCAA